MLVCRRCYEASSDFIKAEKHTEIIEKECNLCNEEINNEYYDIVNIDLKFELKKESLILILGCNSCIEEDGFYNWKKEFFGERELNGVIEDAFIEGKNGIEDTSYRELLNYLDITEYIEASDYCCPKCNYNFESWLDEVKIKSNRMLIPEIPKLPENIKKIPDLKLSKKIEFYRADYSNYLIHLTKKLLLPVRVDNESYIETMKELEAVEILYIILENATIKAFKGIGMKSEAVCFTEKPLSAIKETLFGNEKYVRENSRSILWDSFGLMFEKEYLINKFKAAPVISVDKTEMDKVDKGLHFRVVLGNLNKNWCHEREWRTKESIKFDTKEAIVIVPTFEYAKEFKNILDASGIEVKGFIPIWDISSAI
ncbi:hypothetical protein N9N67_01630 [Bacteriovoracaceae bacterium]|nr:hypothetical protein [Bacteriovoracaceae bacterium]